MGTLSTANGSTVVLGSDPKIAPQPAGITGQVAYYSGEPYFFDGSVWQSALRHKSRKVIEIANLQYDFWADDVSGNESYNASLADGVNIGGSTKWTSKGGTVAANVAANSTSYAQPTLIKQACNGRGGLYFNGNFNQLQITGSASQFTSATVNATYEILFAVNLMAVPTSNSCYIVHSSVVGNTEIGLGIYITSALRLGVIIGGPGGTMLFQSGTIAVPVNQAFYGWSRGDGTTNFLSVNGVEESAAITTANKGAGNMVRDLGIGLNQGTATGLFIGEMFGLTFINGTLTLAQRRNWVTETKKILHI